MSNSSKNVRDFFKGNSKLYNNQSQAKEITFL